MLGDATRELAFREDQSVWDTATSNDCLSPLISHLLYFVILGLHHVRTAH